MTNTRTDPIPLPGALTVGWQQWEYDWQRFICLYTGDIRGIKWRTDVDGSITGTVGWGYYEEAVIPARFAAPAWQTTLTAPGYQHGGAIPKLGSYDPSGLPYTTTKIGAQGEVFIPPHGAYQWKANGTPIPEGHVGLIKAKHEIAITRHYMPFIPIESISKIVGRVNIKPIQLGDHLFQKGTMMSLGLGDVEGYSDLSGNTCYDITYNFQPSAPIDFSKAFFVTSWIAASFSQLKSSSFAAVSWI